MSKLSQPIMMILKHLAYRVPLMAQVYESMTVSVWIYQIRKQGISKARMLTIARVRRG